MQKKLIAAAVAGLIAAPVFAQTNVTISGNMRAGYESYKLGDCRAALSCRNESRVSDQSSGLRFNVVEDLGGGLKAWGQLDYRGAMDGGALANSGNSGVGFMHDSWGKFTIGHWDVHYSESAMLLGTNRAGSLQTFLHNGLLSQVNGTTIGNGTRTGDLLMWDSPNWNGFTARLAYSASGVPGSGEGSGVGAAGGKNPGGGYAWTGALRYQNGPWAAGYSYWHSNQENRAAANTADLRGHRLNLGYTFAMGLKLGLGIDRSTINNGAVGVGDNRRTAWYLPVSYAWGPHAVYFQYAHAGDATNTAGDSGANAWSLGYDYAFSKRTSAGIFYTKLNNKGAGAYNLFALGAAGSTAVNPANNAGADARQIYIGMNHTF